MSNDSGNGIMVPLEALEPLLSTLTTAIDREPLSRAAFYDTHDCTATAYAEDATMGLIRKMLAPKEDFPPLPPIYPEYRFRHVHLGEDVWPTIRAFSATVEEVIAARVARGQVLRSTEFKDGSLTLTFVEAEAGSRD